MRRRFSRCSTRRRAGRSGHERHSRAAYISRKDIESYYGKPPLVTWGLLFPAVLILAMYVRNPGTYLAAAPGVIAMTLLFGNTSMAAIVITFEKRSGTLTRLLLAPVTHRTIIAGKSAGAALYGIATASALAAGLAAALGMPLERPLVFAAGLLLGAGTLSLLGIVAAAAVEEVFEAMTLMNFFRFPVLFVSGVFAPVEQLPAWLTPVALVSPLTHVVELLRFGVTGEMYFASIATPLVASAVFLASSWAAACMAFRRSVTR